ncbi:Chitobiase/beta-hexosaminidase domain 2-like protein [Jimgerdemannia flammicorona]|uniref:beta-N-acetylhexosaminidase n=1 Tax=Jimgerdemannia flammicorona TaxID=994334 RepID=A0A433QT76_9FUNG|nr:Chitobiase/beta-hexosaminidase domain 2-like protein [Jimgerdemannia flammicorona]
MALDVVHRQARQSIPSGSALRGTWIKDAAHRYQELIWYEKWTPVQVAYPNTTVLTPNGSVLKKIEIRVDNLTTKLDVGIDESYTLDIPASGGVGVISAKAYVGALRALETFSQLVSNAGRGLQVHASHIEDWPS